MSQGTKLSEAEIGLLNNLQKEYEQMSVQLGAIETQIVAINTQKETVVEKLKGVYKEELELTNKLKEKYGDGNVDLSSGVFTPAK
tara:strand:- start:425 stop:679 length:255 start_codon:yes stop_codon:yes gene_type:complete